MKSLYTSFLRKCFWDALSKKHNTELIDTSRRSFITNSLVLGTGVLLGNGLLASCGIGQNKRIAIVGAGLGGLSAGYGLLKQNISFKIFEASGRFGGRVMTLKDWCGEGLTTELGGEFIDDSHQEIIALARSLNVPIYDLREDVLFQQDSFFAGGKERSIEEISKAFVPFAMVIAKDLDLLKEEFSYKNADKIKHLDQLSISSYLIKVGVKGWLRALIEAMLTAEYGIESREQSALNFLSILVLPKNTADSVHLLGENHEVKKIKGGTIALVDALQLELQTKTKLNHILKSYHKMDTGSYQLTFETLNGTKEEAFDLVIFNIPFSVLRKIPTNVQYPAAKHRAIHELGYGNNAKSIFGFEIPFWRKFKKSGSSYADKWQSTWESTFAQYGASEQACAFTFFNGGDFVEIIENNSFDTNRVNFFKYLEELYPGISTHSNQKYMGMAWKKNPYSLGSYSGYKVGQWSAFYGAEQEPFENLFFVGEHCSKKFQGFMNGAVETGLQTAELISKRYNF